MDTGAGFAQKDAESRMGYGLETAPRAGFKRGFERGFEEGLNRAFGRALK